VGPTDVDVEQRRDVLAVCLLDLRADVALEARRHLRDLTLRRRGHTARRHVEEDEIVVVREADHDAGGAELVVVEEVTHGARRRLEDRVELLPAVDLLDLGVAHEAEVQHDELAPLLEQLPRALDRDGQRRQARERVVEHLLVLDPVDSLRVGRSERSATRDRRPDARRDLLGRPGQQIPFLGLELDGAAPGGFVGAADEHGNAAHVRELDAGTQQGRVAGGEQQRADPRLAERRRQLR
jgi:hypothetical protein